MYVSLRTNRKNIFDTHFLCHSIQNLTGLCFRPMWFLFGMGILNEWKHFTKLKAYFTFLLPIKLSWNLLSVLLSHVEVSQQCMSAQKWDLGRMKLNSLRSITFWLPVQMVLMLATLPENYILERSKGLTLTLPSAGKRLKNILSVSFALCVISFSFRTSYTIQMKSTPFSLHAIYL